MEKKRLYDSQIGESIGNLMKALPDIVYALDAQGHFVYLNDAVRSLGYEPEALIGRHFSTVIHADDRLAVSREAVLARIRAQASFPEISPKLFDERRSGSRMTRELEVRLIHGTTGETVYASVNAYGEPLVDPRLQRLFKTEGAVTMGAIRDVTADHLYRQSLEENLAAKDILLKELHHRVRDNLQVIASLVHLQEMDVHEAGAKRFLSGLIAQIKSIAIVHEALYQAESSGGVSAKDYFERFAGQMRQSFGYIGSPITLEVEAEDRIIDASRLSYMAIIASEFVANAYKHAFPEGRQGTIRISYASLGDRDELAVSDDGIGLPADMEARPGLGMEISEALAKQKGGRIEKKTGLGARMSLIMPRD